MKLHLRILAPVLLLAAFGCSGDDQEEKPAEEGAPAEGGEEPAAPDEAPAEEPAPAAEPAPAPAPEPAPAPASAEPAGFDGAKVTRYVTTYAVNVRSAPDKTASVLRHHKWGDKLEVVVNGDWAKLNTGEYVSSKVLSETPPKATGGKGKGKAKPKAKKKK